MVPVIQCHIFQPPVEVDHPHVDLALSSVPGYLDRRREFDDSLVRCYGYPGNGGQLFPLHAPLYNKHIGGKFPEDLDYFTYDPISLRNIRVGKPAAVGGLHVGGVSRFAICTFAQNLGGRKTNMHRSFVRVDGGHHEGRNYFALGCKLNPPFLGYCRIVYIDTHKLQWCSISSAAFHSFVWPQDVGKAKSIVRTLFVNHFDWVDVLIIRGRFFGYHRKCFRANRVLENLLWNWSKMRRPYVAYQEGNMAISNCDPVPGWFVQECVYEDFCQCHVLGSRSQGWHRPGALYSNVVCRRFQLFERHCDCSHDGLQFPLGYGRNTCNREIAIKLSRVVMHGLSDMPPSVPPRGEPMVFALTSRKRKPKWERARLRAIRRHYLIREEYWDSVDRCVDESDGG